MKLHRSEQETCISMMADDRQRWQVFSDDPVMIARLDKIAHGQPHGDAGGMVYVLDKSQVSLRQRRAKRILTTEERRAIGERLRAGREGNSV